MAHRPVILLGLLLCLDPVSPHTESQPKPSFTQHPALLFGDPTLRPPNLNQRRDLSTEAGHVSSPKLLAVDSQYEKGSGSPVETKLTLRRNGMKLMAKETHNDDGPSETQGWIRSSRFLGLSALGFSGLLSSLILPASLKRGPFFDGWFIRLTDLHNEFSCSVIMGSIRLPGGSEFAEHYICISRSNPGEKLHSIHLFPSDVTLLADGQKLKGFSSEIDWRAPAAGRVQEFVWSSQSLGTFAISKSGKEASLDFSVSDSDGKIVNMNATISTPKKWGPGESGPEGWLGRTPFLPCRYFVQSLGSTSHYSFGDRVGSATAHIETNYGNAFPSGWIYIQSSGSKEESLLVTGGRFAIGPLTPISWIVAFRAKDRVLDFRTTDLHQVDVRFSCKRRVFLLKARNPFNGESLELEVRDDRHLQAPDVVWFPTVQGFRNEPGCSESFQATANIRSTKTGAREKAESSFRLCALEFGGTFQDEWQEFQGEISLFDQIRAV